MDLKLLCMSLSFTIHNDFDNDNSSSTESLYGFHDKMNMFLAGIYAGNSNKHGGCFSPLLKYMYYQKIIMCINIFINIVPDDTNPLNKKWQ